MKPLLLLLVMYNKLYLALNMINKVLRHRLQLLTALIVGVAFLYVGCEKDKSYTYVDPCADIECLNGGICLDGTCQCPLGLKGKIVSIVGWKDTLESGILLKL